MKIKSLVFIIGMLMFLLLSCEQQAEQKTNTAEQKEQTKTAPYRVGEWLPSDTEFLQQWLDNLITAAEKSDRPLHPELQKLKELIESDAQLYMLFNQMFEQIPNKEPYLSDPTGKPQVRDYLHMLDLWDEIMHQAPEFNKTGLVGFPINAILDWPMGTPAGTAAFLDPRVNAQIKRILEAWAAFLDSEQSAYVLTDDPKTGWFGKDAMDAMPGFVDDFICDPEAEHYGFKTWDNFFTRQFREGRRPVESPDDNSVIANSCESAPYKIAENVNLNDRFWIKAQPYSLKHMFDNDNISAEFTGGTVYQAFLSALSYHRWHSPVSGKIVSTKLIDGSYYAEAIAEGFDPAGPNNSQGYITHTAARGLVLIEADNPDIGLMAVLFVGMAEVSSCEFTVQPGQHINKGDELGMFHFGGSTHCLIFRPDVNLKFDLRGQKPGVHAENIPVRAALARILK